MPETNTKKQLRFGTSGLRDTVENMTDVEVTINTRGFVRYLEQQDDLAEGAPIAVGGDLRESTPRILRAVMAAIQASGHPVDHCGALPSPALAGYAIGRGMPSVMVTGSHIPEDRNGVKFTKKAGEVLKADEAAILRCVADARSRHRPACFRQRDTTPTEPHRIAIEEYGRRYLDVFPPDCLASRRIALYQHSAVGRDILAEVFRKLGAEVIAPTDRISVAYTDGDTGVERTAAVDLRSERFVPVDTEKVTPRTRAVLTYLAEEYRPDFIISADGDTDRPLFADERGNFLPGDKLGFLALRFLMQNGETVQGEASAFAALPISTNDGVVSALKRAGVEVALTKIGSPYVIAAMLDAMAPDLVVGWEANGGFLLGSDWQFQGRTLRALPTRDALLPLLAAMLFAMREGKPASQLIADELPPRYNLSVVTDNHTPGAEAYTPEVGRAILRYFSPGDEGIRRIEFTDDGVSVAYADGRRERCPPSSELGGEATAIRDRLARHFGPLGLRTVMSIDYLDGVRVRFAEADIVYHIRPSGNAPEFRSYVTANTMEEAERIAEGRRTVIPAIIDGIRAVGDDR